ncbi:MAG: squalene synthase HpnC [Bryobacteraceae bacterium]
MHLSPKEFVAAPELMQRRYSPAEATEYTKWLATSHYENFHVVSFLLPKHLHQDFYNVYSFCRWADDLGDEIGDRSESLRLLSWWRGELEACYQGECRHPVFVALRETAIRHSLPAEPFHDLITAFERDQRVTRYETLADVLGYCRYSANPVGRLVLYLCGYRDEKRQLLSDATCTGLQLANFWQDVTVDLEKDRIYLPMEWFRQCGYTEEELRRHAMTPGFREVMKLAVDEARALFLQGLPLVDTVNRRLALDLDLFNRGGMLVLDKIEKMNYDVLSRRPAVSKSERIVLLLRSLCRLPFYKAA